MTMSNNRRDQPPMPKVTQIPAPSPQARPNRAVHDAYADEALRAAQRHIDQIQEIDRLGQELEEWRRRAMLAEAEIKRLEKRENDLSDTLERQRDQLTDERDSYRNRVNSLVSGFHTAGGIILRLLETAQGEVRPNVNLTTLANEIDKVAEQEQQAQAEPRPASTDPLPGFLAAGPRSDEK
jgi:DNA repair exonuclease SbcCD ATPase subunit